MLVRMNDCRFEIARTLAMRVSDLGCEGPLHTARVAYWARCVGEVMGLRGEELDACELGGWLHDIGKIAVPDAVLHKPGVYDDADWRLLRVHSVVGARMLEGIPGMEGARAIVLAHHEHWDGGGYPLGLRKAAIPLGARIFAVVDSYDAMTRLGAEREWGEPRNHDLAMTDLVRLAGSRYDVEVVEAWIQCCGDVRCPTRADATLRRPA